MKLHHRTAIVALALLVATATAHAQTASLGNTASGLADGDSPTILDLLAIQGGQPAPFDAGIGSELFGPDLDATFTFTYVAPVNPILSATLELGIFDHDSAAAGSQLLLFEVGGIDVTALMNAQFEASGGGDNEYNVYAIDLPASVFADFADGSTEVTITLQAPGQQTSIFAPFDVTETNGNAGHLIYSTLDIVAPAVPTPAALPAGLAAMLLLAARRRAS